MPKSRVTLKEIAQQLGVTVTTVSKALKDYPDIGKETKRKVRELAEKLNYVPNNQAIALRSQKTNTIGLILPEVVHYFFSNVIKGIVKECDERGYRLLITTSENKTETEAKHIKLFFRNKVDGVIVSLSNDTTSIDHFNLLKEYDIPLVMFDKIDDSYACNKVVIDDFNSAYLATKHLIDKGCKRIAHISGPQIPSNAIDRKRGYIKALEEAKMPIENSLIKECKDVVFEEGYDFGKELLALSNPPDGIFAVTDQTAVGAIQAAQDAGIKVPEDVKIIGFSDSLVARISKPKLTTIRQPGYDIGEVSAKLLIDEIEQDNKAGSKKEYQKHIVETYLIEREST